jgi:uncharacterized protein
MTARCFSSQRTTTLEGGLTDVTARRIIDEVITPKFRAGDFAGGISDGVARIVAVINGEELAAPAPEASHQEDNDWISFLNPLNPFILFGIYFIATICRSLFGRFVGSVAAGGVVPPWRGSIAASIILGAIILILTFLADSMIAANQNAVRRSGRGAISGGWVGGSYSGGGGGWGGGFSGGGGGFGGGGASGNW